MQSEVVSGLSPAALNYLTMLSTVFMLALLLIPLWYEVKLGRSRGLVVKISSELEELLDNESVPTLLCTEDQILAINKSARDFLTLPADAKAHKLKSLFHHLPEEIHAELARGFKQSKTFSLVSTANEKLAGITLHCTPNLNQQHDGRFLIRFLETELVERHNRFRRISDNIDQLSSGAVITDINLNIVAANHQFSEITGYTEQEVLGAHISKLSSDANKDLYESMWDQISKTGLWSGTLWNRNKQGEEYFQHLTISEITDSDGMVTHFLGTLSDLSRIYNIDSLENNSSMKLIPRIKQLEAEYQLRMSNEGKAKLIVLDIQRFNTIHNTYGARAAEALVESVEKRLREACSSQDFMARIGKDEIAILCGTSSLYLNMLIHEIRQVISRPFPINNTEISISANIGVATSPEHGDSLAEVANAATMASSSNKSLAQGQVAVYTPELRQESVENLKIENQLRNAIESSGLSLVYQPIFDRNKRLNKLEALLRWSHPELGPISPARFIPIAEETGLIREIGDWVITEACRQLKIWKTSGHHVVPVAINLSGHQLSDYSLVDKINRNCKLHGIEPELLNLEVTESVLMEQMETGKSILEDLTKEGFTIAIDDFGTGYSSLAYLNQFPASILKIDRTFVNDIDNKADTRVLDSIIQLANSLDMQMVAEGIETEQQLDYLMASGCQFYQGFLLAKPLPANCLQPYLSPDEINHLELSPYAI